MSGCKLCGRYTWVGEHKCPPEWFVKCAEVGSQGVFYADTPQEAAEVWAQKWDQDFVILAGDTYVVEVMKLGAEVETSRWRVAGESIPRYYATRV